MPSVPSRQNKVLIFFSDIAWEGQRQRPQHLASRFAKSTRVLWVQPMMLHRAGYQRLTRVAQGIDAVSVPAFPYNARSSLIRVATRIISAIPSFRHLLLRQQRRILCSALKQMNLQGEDTIIFLENSQFIELALSISKDTIVFDYIDNLFGFTEFPQYARKLWEKTVHASHIITATSGTLVRQAQSVGALNVCIVSNGVETDRFRNVGYVSRYDDLPQDSNPILGYVGSLYDWFDFKLIERLSASLPNAHIVLIGERHPRVHQALSRLRRCPNVHVLGFKPYEKIPQYVSCFAVGLIPFLRNELTAAVNPVKLYEYAAAGIPTVATNFSPDLNEFHQYILIALSEEDFIRKVEHALRGESIPRKEVLQQWGAQNDWDMKSHTIENLIRQHLS